MEVEFFGMKFGITSYCWIFEPPLIVEWCELLLLFPRVWTEKRRKVTYDLHLPAIRTNMS